jgi:hypothetical protein
MLRTMINWFANSRHAQLFRLSNPYFLATAGSGSTMRRAERDIHSARHQQGQTR